jgi:hypothetical protein
MLQKQLRGEPVTKIAIPGQHGISFIDRQYIVNLNHVKQFNRNEGVFINFI